MAKKRRKQLSPRKPAHLGLLLFTSARFWFNGVLAVWRRLMMDSVFSFRLNFFIQPSFTWYDGWLATVPDAFFVSLLRRGGGKKCLSCTPLRPYAWVVWD
ncbi:hypothetical protein EVAR_66748_1 [Eumeta japonica]|uniref:Uncharacterized protein n=1 Tax=Eumeta variegata TaxID=151549 RepID=A0A4C1Z968_EUMVA|nr:hypothetical protein EVAR_66748_1 [Eumeta japonica]